MISGTAKTAEVLDAGEKKAWVKVKGWGPGSGGSSTVITSELSG
jgi:hypothetical protein